MALTTNLIHYYTFDSDNSNDSVGSLNGTDTSVTYGASYGKIGDGASFDGSASRIVINSTDFERGTGDFSISAWCYQTGSGSFGSDGPLIFGAADVQSGSQSKRFYVSMSSAQNFQFEFYDGTDGAAINYSTSVAQNTWIHVVAVRSGGTANFYLNGYLKKTASNTFGTSANCNLTTTQYGRIGGDHTGGGGGGMFQGYIDEVGFWTRALTAAEVLQLYNGAHGLQYSFSGAVVDPGAFLLGML